MAVGRFLCVALPLILTIGAIVSMLIATLSGVAHNRLSLFSLDTEDLSISRANVDNVAEKLFDVDLPGLKARDGAKSDNITAKDLQLGKSYDVNLWGYCWTDFDSGDRHCTKHEYDWAADSLNTTIQDPTGQIKITLPEELEAAIKAFKSVSKWTQIATVIALIALGVELVIGIFSNFSRVVSCVTWLVAGIATVLVGVAATLATVQAALVVGAVESTAKWYGVRGSINTNYLATVWISFVFALAAGSFWLFTICCCKPDRSSSSRKNKHASSSGEKLFGAPGTGYAPLGNDHEMTSGMYNNGHQAPPYSSAPRYPDASAPRSDMAYEPYSHRV